MKYICLIWLVAKPDQKPFLIGTAKNLEEARVLAREQASILKPGDFIQGEFREVGIFDGPPADWAILAGPALISFAKSVFA